jgi:polyferredoxin
LAFLEICGINCCWIQGLQTTPASTCSYVVLDEGVFFLGGARISKRGCMADKNEHPPERRGRLVRMVRRAVQTFSLLIFYFLLILTLYPYEPVVATNLFLKLSPLNAISTIVAGRALYSAFWVALIPVVLTLVLGRFFCGWICPMGTTIDVCDHFTRKFRKKVSPRKRNTHHAKYSILIVLTVFALFRLNISGWFDPISLATRIYALVLHPYAYFLAGHAFGAIGNLGPQGPIDNTLQVIQRYLFHPPSESIGFYQPYFSQHVLIALIFLAIVLFGLWRRRFYCRNICPLGALFALLSRFSLIRRRVNDNCTECRLCLRKCRMEAIGADGKGTLRGECIECFDCEVVCPQKAIAFSPSHPKDCSVLERVDFTRRELIGSVVGGLASLPLFKLNLFTEKERMRDVKGPGEPISWIIRPPGTLGIDEAKKRRTTDEAYFLSRCIRCGECMKVCPTNGLQPLLLQEGIQGLWTPSLVPRIGHCEFNCTACSDVCPTGALARFAKTKQASIELKQKFVIGKARFDRNKCIPWRAFDRWTDDTEWSDDFNCKTCEEHCPARDEKNERKAIIIIPYEVQTKFGPRSIDRLAVVDDICIGCGICEKVCPVEGEAAVRVARTENRGFTSVRGR